MSDTQNREDDSKEARGTLQQMFNLFVRPEVERRANARTLDLSTTGLSGFQVLMPGSGPLIVRINEEVRITAEISVDSTHRPLRIGEPFPLEVGDRIEAIFLLPEEEGHFAHFSACDIQGTWFFTFDLRCQKIPARENLAVAEEFFATAEAAVQAGHLRAFVDNIFSCVELLAKVDLFLLNQMARGKVMHRDVHTKAATFLHADPLGVTKILGRLNVLRFPARYLTGDFELALHDVRDLTSSVAAILDRSRERVRAYGPSSAGEKQVGPAHLPDAAGTRTTGR